MWWSVTLSEDTEEIGRSETEAWVRRRRLPIRELHRDGQWGHLERYRRKEERGGVCHPTETNLRGLVDDKGRYRRGDGARKAKNWE